MATTTATTLTSLALLRDKIDEGGGHHEFLVPFIENIFTVEAGHSLDTGRVQTVLKQGFGLEIPMDVLNFALLKMSNKGIVRKMDGKNEFSKGDKFMDRNLDAEITKAKEDVDHVLANIVTYAKSLGHNNFTLNDANLATQRFLEDFSIECIKSYVQHTALPELPAGEAWEKTMIAFFVVEAIENDYELFEKFMIIVQGNMLANALLSTDTSTPPEEFRDVTFYLDTPNLFHLVGYGGEENYKSTSEMIKCLVRLGGRIATFEHNIEEAKIVMSTLSDQMQMGGGYGPLFELAVKEKWGRSEFILNAEKFEKDITNFGVSIRKTPLRNVNPSNISDPDQYFHESTNRYEIDEKALEDIIRDEISFIKEKTLLTDIRSIQSIYFLRRGENPRHLESCKAIFVTSNRALARAAYNFSKLYDSEYGYVPVIDNFALTNIAWLKSPSTAENLITTQTIAQAYAALRIPENQLADFYFTLELLREKKDISKEQLDLLRVSTDISRELAYATAQGQSIQEEKTIRMIIGSIDEKFKARETAANQKFDQEKLSHQKTQKKLRAMVEKERDRKAKIHKITGIFANIIFILILALAIPIVAVYLAHSFLPLDGELKKIGAAIGGVLTVYGAVVIFVGIPPLFQIRKKIADGLRNIFI